MLKSLTSMPGIVGGADEDLALDPSGLNAGSAMCPPYQAVCTKAIAVPKLFAARGRIVHRLPLDRDPSVHLACYN